MQPKKINPSSGSLKKPVCFLVLVVAFSFFFCACNDKEKRIIGEENLPPKPTPIQLACASGKTDSGTICFQHGNAIDAAIEIERRLGLRYRCDTPCRLKVRVESVAETDMLCIDTIRNIYKYRAVIKCDTIAN